MYNTIAQSVLSTQRVELSRLEGRLAESEESVRSVTIERDTLRRRVAALEQEAAQLYKAAHSPPITHKSTPTSATPVPTPAPTPANTASTHTANPAHAPTATSTNSTGTETGATSTPTPTPAPSTRANSPARPASPQPLQAAPTPTTQPFQLPRAKDAMLRPKLQPKTAPKAKGEPTKVPPVVVPRVNPKTGSFQLESPDSGDEGSRDEVVPEVEVSPKKAKQAPPPPSRTARPPLRLGESEEPEARAPLALPRPTLASLAEEEDLLDAIIAEAEEEIYSVRRTSMAQAGTDTGKSSGFLEFDWDQEDLESSPWRREEMAKKKKKAKKQGQGGVTWQPDELAHVCPLCESKFTRLLRKHHCRLGSLFARLTPQELRWGLLQ